MLHKPTQQETFQALLDDLAARVRDAFLSAIARIRSSVTLGLVISRLERHDTEGVIRALATDASVYNPMLDEIDAAYSAGGGGIGAELPTIRDPEGFPISISFDVRNPLAEAWLKENGATLVRQITDDQVAMLRNVLSQGMAAGESSRQLALDIVGRIDKTTGQRSGGVLGLTAAQKEWASAYEQELLSLDANALTRTLRDLRFDRTIAKAIDRGVRLSADQVAKISGAYRNNLLRLRGETVARTEVLKALNAARDEAMRQAIDGGNVSGNLVDQHWWTTMDGRERDSHAAMDGQTVPWGQAFVSGAGYRLRYPGDPLAPASEVVGCRCSKTFTIRRVS